MHGPRTERNSNKLTSRRRVLVAASAIDRDYRAAVCPAAADVGMPMIVLVWPGAWVLFLPVVALQSVVAHRLLKLSAGRALRVSFVANLVSTLAGIPVTWLLLLMLQWLIIGVAVNSYSPRRRRHACRLCSRGYSGPLLLHGSEPAIGRTCGCSSLRRCGCACPSSSHRYGSSVARPFASSAPTPVRDGSRILELAGQPVELRWPDGRFWRFCWRSVSHGEAGHLRPTEVAERARGDAYGLRCARAPRDCSS